MRSAPIDNQKVEAWIVERDTEEAELATRDVVIEYKSLRQVRNDRIVYSGMQGKICVGSY